MKAYQKAEMIAKNLPTGSYAAGCPVGQRDCGRFRKEDGSLHSLSTECSSCEVAQ